MHKTRLLAVAMASLVTSSAVFAQNLTPMGAEAGANAAGTIPAYEGGLTQAPAGFVKGKQYVDPYAADKPTLTITPANAEQHKDKLSPGQLALFKKYPSYKMNVYPTRRSAAFPKCHIDETTANKGKAQLAPGGNGVTGISGGIPFTTPKNGNEAIWNSLLRYRGDTYEMHWSQASVTREGSYALVNFEYELDFHYGSCSKKGNERDANKVFHYIQKTTAPARLAGQILLVHETVDQSKDPRSAWTYNPGQRRVRLAPNVAYDNPGTAADGLRTNDDFNMYNGATDRYDWKLVGKKEIYVPYNSYALSSPKLKYADILKPGHINQDHARYELHRVWVVEATLKPGTSHIYSKRTFYIDEDSWSIMLSDKYDARGELWRVSEQHLEQWYDVPMPFGTVEVHYDLQAGRYIAMGLRNEEKLVFNPVKRSAADFTPQNLRGEGTR